MKLSQITDKYKLIKQHLNINKKLVQKSGWKLFSSKELQQIDKEEKLVLKKIKGW